MIQFIGLFSGFQNCSNFFQSWSWVQLPLPLPFPVPLSLSFSSSSSPSCFCSSSASSSSSPFSFLYKYYKYCKYYEYYKYYKLQVSQALQILRLLQVLQVLQALQVVEVLQVLQASQVHRQKTLSILILLTIWDFKLSTIEILSYMRNDLFSGKELFGGQLCWGYGWCFRGVHTNQEGTLFIYVLSMYQFKIISTHVYILCIWIVCVCVCSDETALGRSDSTWDVARPSPDSTCFKASHAAEMVPRLALRR